MGAKVGCMMIRVEGDWTLRGLGAVWLSKRQGIADWQWKEAGLALPVWYLRTVIVRR
jgi:hypothetical protein